MRIAFLIALLSVGFVQAEETAACRTARAKMGDSDWQYLPVDLRDLIEAYRKDWRNFCSDQKTRPTLAELFKKGKQIDKQFESITETNGRDLPIENLSGFVPAFATLMGENMYSSPARDEFRNNAGRGTEEDRLFLSSLLGSDFDFSFPPWLDGATGAGPCVKYGEFDWVGQLGALVELRKKMKSDVYKEEISDFQNRMFQSHAANEIYTCGDKAAVLADLKAIRVYLTKDRTLSQYLVKIQKTIASIGSGEKKIRSYVEEQNRQWE